jgi:thioesterase domain-containing protein
MATHYIEEILALQPQGPFYLGGHSFGGTVAFEMAQQLRANGHQVALLTILDEIAPGADSRFRWGRHSFLGFLSNLPRWVRYDLFQYSPSQFAVKLYKRARAQSQKVGSLIGLSEQRRAAGVDDLFDSLDIPESFRAVCAANYDAVHAYQPQVYPGRILLFRARSQPIFSSQFRDLGWGKLAADGVECKIIPGNHESILTDPAVKTLAARLKASLESARKTHPESSFHVTPSAHF